MAYNLELASRIRAHMQGLPGMAEKKMFGGVGFLLNGNMACGVHGEDMIVRVDRGAACPVDEKTSHASFRYDRPSDEGLADGGTGGLPHRAAT